MNWFKKHFSRNWKIVWASECKAEVQKTIIGFVTYSGKLSGTVLLKVDELRSKHKCYANIGGYNRNVEIYEILPSLQGKELIEFKGILKKYNIPF